MNKSYLNSVENTALSLKPSRAIHLLLMVLFVSITSMFSFGQSQTFITSGTFIAPAGVTSVTVECWGAGGAGGMYNSDYSNGGGGGGGAYKKTVGVAVVAGTSYTITVGTGGVASVTATARDGGATSAFLGATTVTANGGKGGTDDQPGQGGSGGAAGTFKGGDGADASNFNYGGGGGSSAGSSSNGSTATNAAGASAVTGGGAGGVGAGISGGNGTVGGFPGGGGGGGRSPGVGVFYSGGNGANGQVKISWTCATYALTATTTATPVCGSGNSIVTLTSTSLPDGTYTVTYSTTNPNSTGNTASMTFSGTTGTFTTKTLSATSTITVGTISSGTNPSICSSAISSFNTATVTVRPVFTTGTISSTGQTICYNGDPSVIGSATAASGGDNAITYKWQANGVDIASSNSATYDPPTGLTANTTYTRFAKDNTCNTTFVASSGSWVVTVNPVTVGGTISGGSTPICQGNSTGTLSLSGQVGTVVQWERKLDSGVWSNIGFGGSTTFSEIPYAAGTWQYRALLQSGSCTSAYSSVQTIVVSPAPVGGGIYTGNNTICINSSTGAMNLTGYTGAVVRWEKRLLPSATWTNIANTTATYTESPSVGGTWEYRAVVGSGSCATVYSSVKQVIVNPELTIAFADSNATICQTTTTASFAYSSTTGSPAGWIVNFNSAAIAAGFSSPQNNSISGTSGTITVNVPWSVAPGVYNATLTVITYSPACSSVSYPITVTVGVSTPMVGTITHLNCATPTGSVVLSGLPASGTINQTGDVLASYPITGTTMTISGLAAGTYNFSVSNGICSSSVTGNVVINPIVANTWTTSWSNGTPNSNQKLVFTGAYPPAVDPDVDINGCSCMISGGAAVTIKSGRTLTITNEVTVVGGGILTFEDKASLVQINNVVNSGDIIYKRTTSSVLASDYTYWSSPVANQNLSISPSYASGMFFSYNDFAVPEDWKSETATSVMLTGKGYIIRGPQITGTPPPPGFYSATFKGVPNNGTKTIAIGSAGTSSLLGNPYPSAISADLFLAANSTLIEGTIYFWTHKTAIQLASNIASGKAGSGVLAYTSDDYASYNGTGGVAVVGGVVPNGKIAAGQAFFTTSLGAGIVTFNNAMRLAGTTLSDVTGVNQQFFKTKNTNTNTAKAIEKNRVWLNLANAEGAFKQTLVGYITDATNEYDSRFDGESFDGNEFVDFYSINQDKNLVIQGRALPFDENDEVPLGYRTTIDGTFTINIDQVDGTLTNQAMFLEDKLTNTVFDLKSGNYTFNTVAGTFDDRFVLRYTDLNKTLSVDEIDTNDGIIILYSNNYKTLIIKNNVQDTTVNSVTLFNMAGQKITDWGVEDREQTSIQIPIKNLNPEIYIVKVKTTKGETSKKIVVR